MGSPGQMLTFAESISMNPYLAFLAGTLITMIVGWILHNNAFKKQLYSIKQLQQEKDILLERTSKAESRHEFLVEKLATQKHELDDIGEKFKFEFRNLAQSILDEKSEKFTRLNEEKM